MFKPISKIIGQITLNRPEALNALNGSLVKELVQDLEEAKAQKALRVLIITGSGEKAFSAGADLKERSAMSLENTRSFLTELNSIFDDIEAFAMPTIAYINGVAFGGGLELALSCDLRLAHPSAQMGLTECALGIIPGAGGTQRLPELIGYSKAAELIFGARKINSLEALQIGLINQITESPLEFALQIADCSPLSLKAAKKALQVGDEQACYEPLLHAPDRLEGIQAFLEKRKAMF